MKRLMTKSEAKLVAAFQAALVLWTKAVVMEFNCCAEHKVMAGFRIETMLLRFGEMVFNYSSYRITTEEMTHLITAMTTEMTTETKTLVGLNQLDQALKAALIQKEARA